MGNQRTNSKLKLTLHDVAERSRTIDAGERKRGKRRVISTPRRYGPAKSRSTKREQVS